MGVQGWPRFLMGSMGGVTTTAVTFLSHRYSQADALKYVGIERETDII